ncbi:hypothetical protein D5S17_28835 [Pseudonocardiaceae bacterium YIM PH 21723]|nr:hypothetical protein D5S17_28835 [Pseudonocardiaceae bacterium YIM PH 21723]
MRRIVTTVVTGLTVILFGASPAWAVTAFQVAAEESPASQYQGKAIAFVVAVLLIAIIWFGRKRRGKGGGS